MWSATIKTKTNILISEGDNLRKPLFIDKDVIVTITKYDDDNYVMWTHHGLIVTEKKYFDEHTLSVLTKS
jgi:hypothetical protein